MIPSGNKEGMADPGWRWLVHKVMILDRVVRYEVVAESAPGMYCQWLREGQIAKAVTPKVPR